MAAKISARLTGRGATRRRSSFYVLLPPSLSSSYVVSYSPDIYNYGVKDNADVCLDCAMHRLSLLPVGLIALLWSSPALTAATEPTTPLDPFHHISKFVQRTPEPPICCLRPPPSVEPSEEILSFEDWKSKQPAEKTFYTSLDYHEAYRSGKLTPLDVVEALLPLVRRDVKDATKHSIAFLS